MFDYFIGDKFVRYDWRTKEIEVLFIEADGVGRFRKCDFCGFEGRPWHYRWVSREVFFKAWNRMRAYQIKGTNTRGG